MMIFCEKPRNMMHHTADTVRIERWLEGDQVAILIILFIRYERNFMKMIVLNGKLTVIKSIVRQATRPLLSFSCLGCYR